MSYELNSIIENIRYKLGEKQSSIISDELHQLLSLDESKDLQISELHQKLFLLDTRFKRVIRDLDDEDED